MKKWLSLFFIVFCTSTLFAQRFSKYYDSQNINDVAASVIRLSDNSFVAIGQSIDYFNIDTFNYAKTQWLFIHVDSLGDTLHTKTIRKKYFYHKIYGNNILLGENNSVYFIGDLTDLVLYKKDTANSLIQILKFNSNGDTLFTKIIDPIFGYNLPAWTLATSDGGYIIYGQSCTPSVPIKNCDYYLLKVDSLWNTLWFKTYKKSNTHWENPVQFVETKEHGYMLFGYTNLSSDDSRYWFLVRTDSLGNQLWSKTYGKLNRQTGVSICKTQDGNYLLAGSLDYEPQQGVIDGRGWVIKINPNGIILWEKEFSSTHDAIFYSILEKPNRHILVQGLNASFNARHDPDSWLLELDSLGIAIWERVFDAVPNAANPKTYDIIDNFILNPDGSILMVGNGTNTAISNNTSQDIWLLKVDSFGCLTPGCQLVGIDKVPIDRNEVSILPNPASEWITLSHDKIIVRYTIATMLGIIQLKNTYSASGINISKLVTGNYILQVVFEDGSQGFGRLMVE